ncbi:MAG TPA: restriction endonuclease, partial [Phycisphaerae bacterium]|nr:restriction endonuclease [Phycisphaerae bacterium]
MALWLLRGGVHGEDVQRFLDENRVWVNWLNCVDQDLGLVDSKPDMRKLLKNALPEKTKMGVANVLGMFWCFVKKMKPGDWVIVPHKGKPAMNIAEITSDYIFDPKANDPPRHYRNVKWIETDIPRSNFDQDLLYSLGGFRSIYEIKRNDAERRVRGMTKAGWKSSVVPAITDETGEDESIDELPDLERLARDQLAKLI